MVELRFTHARGARRGRCRRLAEFGERVEALPTACSSTPDAGEGRSALVGDGELRPESVYVRRSTLEDVFLILTGRTLED